MTPTPETRVDVTAVEPDFVDTLRGFAAYCDGSAFSADDGPMLAGKFRDAAFVVDQLTRLRDGKTASGFRLAPAAPAPEKMARLNTMYAKMASSPLGMSDEWASKASGGKPYLSAGRRGTLAYGTIGSWDELEFVAALVNAWPSISAAFANPPPPVAASAVDAMRAAVDHLANSRRHDARKVLEEALVTTPSSADSKAARVRKLEWEQIDTNTWKARTEFGEYFAWEIDGQGVYKKPGDYAGILVRGGLAGAKEKAGLINDRRVRACLETGEVTHRDAWAAAARSMLAVLDGSLKGADVDRNDVHHVIHAGCFAAQAYEATPIDRDPATIALTRAFLVALMDMADPRLDYLRAGSTPPPAAEEG